jgi:hypothetical protein
MDLYFRMEVEGWENIRAAPVLLVGIHSGAPFVLDAWTDGVRWWRHFGRTASAPRDRPRRAVGAPGVGGYFRKRGVLPAAPDSITAALVLVLVL